MATDHNFIVKNGLEVGGVLIVNSSGQLEVSTVVSDLHLQDNIKAKFGLGSDLQIYHDGSHSYIKDTGSGNLVFDTNGNGMFFKHGDETLFEAYADGAVNLYYDNTKKFETTSGGVSVSGGLDTTGNIAINKDVAKLTINNNTANTQASIDIKNTGLYARYILDGDDLFRIYNQTSGFDTFAVKSNGDLYMGSTKWFDLSRNLTNIGTISSGNITSSGTLTTQADSAAAGISIKRTNSSTAGAKGHIGFRDSAGYFVASIDSRGTGVNNSGDLRFFTSTGQSYTGAYSNPSATLILGTDNSATFAGTISSGAITSSSNITLSSDDTQIKFTGTGGPFGLEFGDTENNPNFRIYYRTSPNSLTFEDSSESAKHTFTLDGDYTAARDLISSQVVRVGTSISMGGGNAKSIDFTGTGTDTVARKFIYEQSDHHYVTNRHTDGDLVLMSNNGTGGGETTRITLQSGSGTQDIDITNANLDMNSNNINNVGTISSGAINTTGNITITSTYPTLRFVDTDNNPDMTIVGGSGQIAFYDETNSGYVYQYISGQHNFNAKNLTNIGTISSGMQTITYTGSATPTSGATGLRVIDSRTAAAGVGGSISLTGAYNGTTLLGQSPYIRAYKANGSQGDYSFGLKFGIRKNGSGSAAQALQIDEDKNATFAGTISSGAITSTGAIQGTSFSDGTISGITFIDEDSFATNSATRVPTQQSIKAYVDAQVAGVVDSAPAALDTLNELAAALGDDASFSTTTSTALGNRLRVDTASQGLTGTQQANAITNLGITATKAELNFVDGVTSNIQTQLDGKQASGSYLTGNQTITLSGDVSGSGTTSITVTIADDSHNHVISNVDGLQTALDAKAPTANPDFTGTADFGLITVDTNGGTSSVADEFRIGADNYDTGTAFSGVTIRPSDGVNPDSGGTLLMVRSGGGSPRFFVQHDGRVGTSNNDIYVATGTDMTGGNRVFHDGYHPNADTLTTARTIGGVSFNGSANINLPGVNTAGNQNTSGTAAGLSGTPNITVGTISSGAITTTAPIKVLQPSSSVTNELLVLEADDANADIIMTDNTGSVRLRTSGNGDFLIFTGGSATSQNASGSTTALTIDQNQNATFAGTITATTVNTGQGATEVHLMNQNVRTTDSPTFAGGEYTGTLTIDSGTSMGVRIEHDTFGNGLELHREDDTNAASIKFSNNSGTSGILFAIHAETDLYWRKGTGTTNYRIWTEENDGPSSGLNADLLDGQHGSYYAPSSTALTTSTSFGGDVSGTYNAIVVADDSHNHVISNVDGLQTALDGKLSTTGTAANSQQLDSLDSTQFLRSDANDSYSGVLSLTGELTLATGSTRIDGSDGHPLVQVNSTRAYFGSTNRAVSTIATNSTTGLKANVSGTDYTVFHAGNSAQFTSALNTKLSGIATGADVTPSWVPSSDPSYATQSYVGTQISNIVDSAPSTLDTLNELAAALGDDANFSTTVTNSIATKLPLAGGTMTGNIAMGNNDITGVDDLTFTGANSTISIPGHSGIEIDITGSTAGNIRANAELYLLSQTSLVSLGASGTNNLLRVTSTETVINDNSNAYNFRVESNNNANMIHVDGTNDRVGIGRDPSTHPFEVQGHADFKSNMTIDGSLTATTKSFDIEHPTKEGMRLHHGVLEGPEHAVYIRGKSNSYIIELPDYWEGLVHEDTITVQLTPIGGQNDMWIENIEDNKVYINCESEMKQYFYFIQAERKDIERFEVEYGNSVQS